VLSDAATGHLGLKAEVDGGGRPFLLQLQLTWCSRSRHQRREDGLSFGCSYSSPGVRGGRHRHEDGALHELQYTIARLGSEADAKGMRMVPCIAHLGSEAEAEGRRTVPLMKAFRHLLITSRSDCNKCWQLQYISIKSSQ
jgi:hypothetical protein